MAERDSGNRDKTARGFPISVDDFGNINPRLLEVDGVPTRRMVRLERELAQFRSWLTTKRKDPDRNKPLSEHTADDYIFRVQQFWIFAWANSRQISTSIAPEYADTFVDALDDDSLTKEPAEAVALSNYNVPPAEAVAETLEQPTRPSPISIRDRSRLMARSTTSLTDSTLAWKPGNRVVPGNSPESSHG